MACDYCGTEKYDTPCCGAFFYIDKRMIRPFVFGEEDSRWLPAVDSCRDCGAKRGQPHHSDCDWERCPNCQGQAFSCGCAERRISMRLADWHGKVEHEVLIGSDEIGGYFAFVDDGQEFAVSGPSLLSVLDHVVEHFYYKECPEAEPFSDYYEE